MYVYASEPDGRCLGAARAKTHGGWIIYDGDPDYIGGAIPFAEVGSKREAIETLEGRYGPLNDDEENERPRK